MPLYNHLNYQGTITPSQCHLCPPLLYNHLNYQGTITRTWLCGGWGCGTIEKWAELTPWDPTELTSMTTQIWTLLDAIRTILAAKMMLLHISLTPLLRCNRSNFIDFVGIKPYSPHGKMVLNQTLCLDVECKENCWKVYVWRQDVKFL